MNTKETAGENNNAKTQPKKFWLRRALSEPSAADWIIAAFTIVIGVVGIFQWLVIRGQLRVMEEGGADTHELAVQAKNQAIESGKANDFARDALVRVQRAFITIDTVPEMQTSLNNGVQSMWFAFYIENSGTTPTRRLEAHINWLEAPGTMPSNFAFPDAGAAERNKLVPVIGPKAKFPLIAGPISREFIEKLYRNEVHLYIYGWAAYNDIFDKTPRHITRFCYEVVYGGITRLPNGQEGPGIRIAITGTRFNCYDEECKQ